MQYALLATPDALLAVPADTVERFYQVGYEDEFGQRFVDTGERVEAEHSREAYARFCDAGS